MDYQEIAYEVADGVATITLDRPERMNAFTDVMIREWASALDDARVDRDVRVVILTGAGRGFCAGADMEATFKSRLEGVDPGADTAEGSGGNLGATPAGDVLDYQGRPPSPPCPSRTGGRRRRRGRA